MRKALFCLLTVLSAAFIAKADEPAKITVSVDQPGHKVAPTLWGVFFEDINLSTDGGIYPELVRNRSFEDADSPTNWTFHSPDWKSEASISTADVHAQPPPLNAFNRSSLLIKADGAFTLENDGYWGMNIVQGDSYTLKLAARATDGYDAPLSVQIVNSEGKKLAAGELKGFDDQWKYYSAHLTASDTDPKAHLEISGTGTGKLYLDMVSLMPDKTWKNHGLREDLAESLDALHPSFLRFPGGCWVEGDDFAHMNHWKNTVGNIDTRTPLWNIWGYNATQGMGFFEYLQLAEDLGAEPLFCINVGMSHKEHIPMDRMAQWVQDALDAIEYANGPTNSVWGSLRAAAGHPAPFNLKYMEIGNENGGRIYAERWPLFVHAIRAKYPYIKFVANDWSGGYPHEPMPDIVDEHYYESPEAFMRRAHQYDSYDRNGPKIFVGEYAVTQNAGKGNLRAALGEAAFMTGMERNSDVVVMASYAPLFVNLNHRAWNPDLINFDSSSWYGLPSYYVQEMFSNNRGDVTLPVAVNSGTIKEPPPTGCIGVGTWNTAAEFKDVQVTAPDGTVLFQSDFSNGNNGWKLLGDGADWKVENGALRQNAERTFIRALAGSTNWTDYTLTLKARKLSGQEGFLVLFHINGDEDRTWWNIGGWNNTRDAVELDGAQDSKDSHIETDRWYDIKVELRGESVKCWLDGKLIHDLKNIRHQTDRLYASATRDDASGDVIVKVVNAAPVPIDTEIALNGAGNVDGPAKAIVLTSDSPRDENSLEEPKKVSPKTETFDVNSSDFHRTFPGNSFTVLRIRAKQ